MTAIDFSSFVDQLATASGDTILPFFRTALAIENKKAGGFDPVTEADRAAEQSMRTLIRKQFPGHGIRGEEYGSERTDAEYVWVSTQSTARSRLFQAYWPGYADRADALR